MRFVTLFPGARNVHLLKGVGQIPYQMKKIYGYESELVTFKNEDMVYAREHLGDFQVSYLPQVFGYKAAMLSVFVYLILNARRIHVLHLVHLKKRPIIYGVLYKLLNPRGFLYYKLDSSDPDITFNVKGVGFGFKTIVRKLGYLAIKKANVVSSESRYVVNKITRVPSSKLIQLSNGFDSAFATALNKEPLACGDKEKLLLCVGKHGDYAKNSELLLSAITHINDFQGWRIVFVGVVRDHFQQKVDELLRSRPELKDVLVFEGHISDKEKLYDYYKRSSILCLPSRSEGFSNVLVEALFFGVIPVTTRHIASSRDITDDGRVGRMVPNEDSDALRCVIEELIADSGLRLQLCNSAKDWFTANFEWQNILRPLHERIQEHFSTRSF